MRLVVSSALKIQLALKQANLQNKKKFLKDDRHEMFLPDERFFFL